MEKEIMSENKKVEDHKSSEATDQGKGEKFSRSKKAQKHDGKEIEKLKSEIGELKDKYLRIYSEFENYRRRTSREKFELVSTANEELMVELLPVIDDFERAIKALEENDMDIQAVKEGIVLIFNKLKNVTEKKGLKPMESKPGDSFDTEIHDAITQIPVPEENLKGKVVDTVEKGYYLNDKVIRFAKVVIGA
ncbi:MAG: nucleotide exchange factor GrpE [Cyclobacteriaceae bacterium]|nr:nucleotide exchange factor GrpE [Cyclobacteriaceae bacterium]